MNANNIFSLTGRIAHDIHVFEKRDGSHKVMMTIAVQNNYKDENARRGAQFINVEAFVPHEADGLGVYDYVHKGDLLSVSGSIRSSVYQDKKTGKDVFKQVLNARTVTLLAR